MTDVSGAESNPRPDTVLPPAITHVNGGVKLDASQVDIGGDVAGRDKVESAGGHIIHAAAGATVIVGALPDVVGQGLMALHELMRRSPDVRQAVFAFQTNFQTAHEQVDTLADYKDLHDILHRLQFQCYDLVVQTAGHFPGDDMTRDNLTDYQLTLDGIVDELRQVSGRSPAPKQELIWIEDVRLADSDLSQAIQALYLSLLKRVIWRLNRVLAIQPSHINALLNQQARALRLPVLLSTLSQVSDNLTALKVDADKASQFQGGVEALRRLADHLAALVEIHDGWQAVELELRRIAALLDQDLQDLEMSWPDLKAKVAGLCGDSHEEWAITLQKDADILTAALPGQNRVTIKRCFRSFRRRASDRFFRIDADLKEVCGELRTIGEPLALVLRMIE